VRVVRRGAWCSWARCAPPSGSEEWVAPAGPGRLRAVGVGAVRVVGRGLDGRWLWDRTERRAARRPSGGGRLAARSGCYQAWHYTGTPAEQGRSAGAGLRIAGEQSGGGAEAARSRGGMRRGEAVCWTRGYAMARAGVGPQPEPWRGWARRRRGGPPGQACYGERLTTGVVVHGRWLRGDEERRAAPRFSR
jgi:hypothetical protein